MTWPFRQSIVVESPLNVADTKEALAAALVAAYPRGGRHRYRFWGAIEGSEFSFERISWLQPRGMPKVTGTIEAQNGTVEICATLRMHWWNEIGLILALVFWLLMQTGLVVLCVASAFKPAPPMLWYFPLLMEGFLLTWGLMVLGVPMLMYKKELKIVAAFLHDAVRPEESPEAIGQQVLFNGSRNQWMAGATNEGQSLEPSETWLPWKRLVLESQLPAAQAVKALVSAFTSEWRPADSACYRFLGSVSRHGLWLRRRPEFLPPAIVPKFAIGIEETKSGCRIHARVLFSSHEILLIVGVVIWVIATVALIGGYLTQVQLGASDIFEWSCLGIIVFAGGWVTYDRELKLARGFLQHVLNPAAHEPSDLSVRKSFEFHR
jgi:hypothetical protein